MRACEFQPCLRDAGFENHMKDEGFDLDEINLGQPPNPTPGWRHRVAENSTERVVLKNLKYLFYSLLSSRPCERIVHLAFDVGRS